MGIINSDNPDPTDNAHMVIQMVEKLRRYPQMRAARFVIAPESNLGAFASSIYDQMNRSGMLEYIVINLDRGGQLPGIRTNEHNKMSMGLAYRYMMDRKEIRVWKNFATINHKRGDGDRDLWKEYVRQMSKFLRIVEPPKESGGRPKIKLTGKHTGSEDDLIMCSFMFPLVSRAWELNQDIFTDENNPFNHSSLRTQSQNMGQIRQFMQAFIADPLQMGNFPLSVFS